MRSVSQADRLRHHKGCKVQGAREMISFNRLGRPVIRAAGAVLALSLVVACSSEPKNPQYVEASVGTLYNRAMDQLLAQSYEEAAKLFDEVDRQHPYSRWATRAQILSAYSKYRAKKYDDAVIGLDRYIQLHPNSRTSPTPGT